MIKDSERHLREKLTFSTNCQNSRRIKVSLSIILMIMCVEEQIERNQLFFVLEQFFADTKQKEAEKKPLDKAQQTILEYFKDTENTYFFDKNKIL